MTDDDLIEEIARALDPEVWDAHGPIPTRSATIAYHRRRQNSVRLARAALAVVRKRECAVLDSYANENQRFHDEILMLRAVICSALDDLECNDEPGCLAILKTAAQQMPAKKAPA